MNSKGFTKIGKEFARKQILRHMGVKEYHLTLVQIVQIDAFLVNAIMIIMVKIHFYQVSKIQKEKGILEYVQDLYIHFAETSQRVMRIIFVYIETSQKNKQKKCLKASYLFESHFIFACLQNKSINQQFIQNE
ncbi:hypothetical protein ABPG74_001375 [Tetrahymena malaccensis]